MHHVSVVGDEISISLSTHSDAEIAMIRENVIELSMRIEFDEKWNIEHKINLLTAHIHGLFKNHNEVIIFIIFIIFIFIFYFYILFHIFLFYFYFIFIFVFLYFFILFLFILFNSFFFFYSFIFILFNSFFFFKMVRVISRILESSFSHFDSDEGVRGLNEKILLAREKFPKQEDLNRMWDENLFGEKYDYLYRMGKYVRKEIASNKRKNEKVTKWIVEIMLTDYIQDTTSNLIDPLFLDPFLRYLVSIPPIQRYVNFKG